MSKKIMLTADVDDQDVQHEKSKYSSAITSNDIYFYSDVNIESTFLINKSISDLSKQLLINQITFDLTEPAPIKLYINSDGGEVFGALSTVDRIKSNKVPVHSYVEGLVASAATLISVSCHKRYMSKNAVMLIHQVRSWFQGTHENFKDENRNLDVLSNIIKNIYLKHTKFTDQELTELLKHDIYLSADEALKYGLVDEII
jgi:ATP-dependent Clp endopeptidase proteolytic subunit ClpP